MTQEERKSRADNYLLIWHDASRIGLDTYLKTAVLLLMDIALSLQDISSAIHSIDVKTE